MLSTQARRTGGTAPPRTRGPTPAAGRTVLAALSPTRARRRGSHLDSRRPRRGRTAETPPTAARPCRGRSRRRWGSHPDHRGCGGFVGLRFPDREHASRTAGDDVAPVGSEVGHTAGFEQRAGKVGHLGRGGEAGIPHQRRAVVDRARRRAQVPSGENAMSATPSAGGLRRQRDHRKPTASDDAPHPDRAQLGWQWRSVSSQRSSRHRRARRCRGGRTAARRSSHRRRTRRCRWPRAIDVTIGTPRRVRRTIDRLRQRQPHSPVATSKTATATALSLRRPPSSSHSDRTTCSPDCPRSGVDDLLHR